MTWDWRDWLLLVSAVVLVMGLSLWQAVTTFRAGAEWAWRQEASILCPPDALPRRGVSVASPSCPRVKPSDVSARDGWGRLEGTE